MDSSNKDYEFWDIYEESNQEFPRNTYRAEALKTLGQPSPLTLISLKMDKPREGIIRHMGLNHFLKNRIVWRGKDNTLENPPVLQRYDCFQLVFVVHGPISVLIENKRYDFKRGDVFLLNRNMRNAFIFQEGSEAMVLSISSYYWTTSSFDTVSPNFRATRINQFFRANTAREFYENRDYAEFHPLKEESTKQSMSLLQELKEELEACKPGYPYMVCGLVLRYLMHLDDGNAYKSAYISLEPSKGKELSDAIRLYLEGHPRRILWKELEEQFHYSHGYLAAAFQKHTGRTVSDYNREVYLREAARLLEQTTQSVSMIAGQIGLVNRTQFYRSFMEQYHMSPLEYRQYKRQMLSDLAGISEIN